MLLKVLIYKENVPPNIFKTCNNNSQPRYVSLEKLKKIASSLLFEKCLTSNCDTCKTKII